MHIWVPAAVQDAIVVSKASLDRGFGRCIVNHSYKGQLKRYINRTSDRIVAPAAAQRTGRYKALGPDGLADVGTQIGPGAATAQPFVCSAIERAEHNHVLFRRGAYGRAALTG